MRPVSELQRQVAPFEVVSDYQPAGDQPTAIAELEKRMNGGVQDVVLMGATGTGKTATTAWLAERRVLPAEAARARSEAARMAGIVPMGDLSHELETLVMQMDSGLDTGPMLATETIRRMVLASTDPMRGLMCTRMCISYCFAVAGARPGCFHLNQSSRRVATVCLRIGSTPHALFWIGRVSGWASGWSGQSSLWRGRPAAGSRRCSTL